MKQHLNEWLNRYEWSVRTGNVLNMAGIDSQEKFMALTRHSVMTLPNAGRKTWGEVEEMQKYIMGGRPVLASLIQAAALFNSILPHIDTDVKVNMETDGSISVYQKLFPKHEDT